MILGLDAEGYRNGFQGRKEVFNIIAPGEISLKSSRNFGTWYA